ncbi:hypothetical protein N0V93_000881 [Gnomoniopsis smithogilvyi]|uniref:Ankyrin n=1 Tax=Gnomoniopsis smithogilvyi TaxID=1191159 RepID=A0A9W8Z2P3_9PEZI|nr:hypothetical protein N0V93_000881 [Gnomoniopsis smithogilvyi]
MATEAPDVDASERMLEKIQQIAAAGDLVLLQRALKQLDTKTVPLDNASNHDQLELQNEQWLIQGAFDKAAEAGHLGLVAYLLEQRSCVPSSFAVRGAVKRKHWGVVDLLLRSGWDINQPIDGGNTLPVMFQEHVQWLLEHGADPMIRSVGKNNHMASQAGRFSPTSVLRLLRAHGADFGHSNAIHEAAAIGGDVRLEAMAYLLDEALVPINMRQWEWDDEFFSANSGSGNFGTALHAAVRQRKAACVQFLLERGADPLVEDTTGQTPFDLARHIGFEEGLALLERSN